MNSKSLQSQHNGIWQLANTADQQVKKNTITAERFITETKQAAVIIAVAAYHNFSKSLQLL